jgi:hypothetical protein
MNAHANGYIFLKYSAGIEQVNPIHKFICLQRSNLEASLLTAKHKSFETQDLLG